MSDKNIHQRMAAITKAIGTVAKNLSVSAGKGSSYKAVGERDVIDAVKPIEEQFGVYSYPVSRKTVASEILESESNGYKRTTFYTRLETVYRFVNVDDPNDYIETTVYSVGMDSGDKGDGKAMTYADKYALMKMYKISTGDDPDQEGSIETDYRKGKKSGKTCDRCGGYILPVTKKDGTTMTPEDLVAMSYRDFGKQLCGECYKAMHRESKDS